MIRSWIGLGLLIGLLLVGLLLPGMLEPDNARLEQTLHQAARESLAGNRQAAVACFTAARELWQRRQLLRSFLFSHSQLEDVEAALSQGEVYLRCEDSEAFAALCRSLAATVHAFRETHILTWENLL